MKLGQLCEDRVLPCHVCPRNGTVSWREYHSRMNRTQSTDVPCISACERG